MIFIPEYVVVWITFPTLPRVRAFSQVSAYLTGHGLPEESEEGSLLDPARQARGAPSHALGWDTPAVGVMKVTIKSTS